MAEGKITVTHFLNKNLQATSEGRSKKYPLYVRVRFENKKTEFRSKADLFFYSGDVSGLIDELNSGQGQLSLSEKEFEQASDDYRLINERNAIHEIVLLFKQRKNVNLIEGGLIEKVNSFLLPIDELISNQLKSRIRDQILMSKQFIPVYKMIDWDRNSFHSIFLSLNLLTGTQTDFYKEILRKYSDWFVSIQQLRRFLRNQRRQVWLYEWGVGTLRVSLMDFYKTQEEQGNSKEIISLIDLQYKEHVGL